MRIETISQKSEWENFLDQLEEKTFLQSWNWGEFQKMMGNKIWRLGIYENDSLLTTALIIKISAKRGTFLFLPHGPNIKIQNSKFKIQNLKDFLEKLKKIAKEENCSFIRIAPIWERNNENAQIFKDLGFRDAPLHIHPEVTWELDIRPSEEELLKQMRKTTRYLIRQAQKNKEIEIYQRPALAEATAGKENLKDIEIFNNLYQEVAARHHFVPFSLDYLKKEFLAFSPDNQISLFFGKYKNEIVSSGIFIFWQEIAFYHHGATSLRYPRIPISYLLQWEAIKEAKRRGCQKFNFWGIAPFLPVGEKENAKFWKHPWAGLTLFKMGFGGYKKEYLKTQDLILSAKYWANYFIEKLRKIRRRL